MNMTNLCVDTEQHKNVFTGTIRVLIVDDSKVIRDRLVYILSIIEEVEFVGEAADTSTALLLHETTNPDFVILDLGLPGEGGFSVLREIKSKTPATMVAVLTSYSHVAYRERCLEFGADYFFDKSTEFEKIKAVLTSGDV